MSKGKLLLADDSVTIQKVVNLTFADEGIDVVTAGNGDAAMEMIAAERPDVILADVNMPGLNGYQICEKLRQSDETKEIPVLLLVGSFEPFDEAEAKRVGASGFLTKPFQSIRTLVAQVTELLESSVPTAEPSDEAQQADDNPWSVPATEEPQTSDIDDLYHQSFSNINIGESADETVAEIVDAGMDDEMIETSYFTSEAGVGNEGNVSSSPFEERVSEENGSSRTIDGFPRSTEADEFPIRQQTAPFYDEQRASGIELEPVEREEAIEAQSAEPPYNRVPLDTAQESYGLSDGDLLELPGAGPRSFASPKTASGAGSGATQVINLSPEQIDLIVQKVIEKMSETR